MDFETFNKIENAIMASFGPDKTASWEVIVAHVNAAVKIRKNGWMSVRGVLQDLINTKQIVRTDSVLTETYQRLT
jgi:hypothetical protein